MTRRLLAALFATATAFVLVARAEPDIKIKPVTPGGTSSTVPKDETDPKARIDDAANQQDRLKRQFEEFKLSLLRLAQRMENSARQEDKDKAAVLKEALAKASEMGTDQKFGTLISSLKASDTFKDTDKLSNVIGRNDELRKDLNTLIEMLQKDDKEADLRRRRQEVMRMLEQLKEIIAKEERVRVRIDLARQKPTEIKPDQDKANTDMRKLADPTGIKKTDTSKSEGKLPPKSDSKDGKPGESKADAKDPKGEERPREGKPDDSKETKPGDPKEAKPGDPKESKPGDSKEAKPGDPKEGKPGDAKENKGGDKPDSKPSDPKDGKGADNKESKPSDGKPSEGKPGDPKPGEGKPAESKPGDSKESKGGDSKESKPSDGKPNEAKPGEPKPGEGKPGDGKPGEAKPAESKPGDSKVTKPTDPKEAKPGEGKPSTGAKPGDPKPGEGKPGEGKPGDPKPGEAKPGDAKPGEGKPSDSKAKGDGKGDAKPGSGKPGDAKPGEGKPSSGKPSDAKPGEGKPGGGSSGSPPPGAKPPPPPPPSETDPARKKIKDAADSGDKASNELEKNKPDQAGPKVDDAIDKLNQAKKQLEDLLKQLREQEVERILAQLQARCEKMLAMQTLVRDGTVVLDKNIKGHEDQKPTRVDEQVSNGLADKEDLIVKEAGSAIRIIEAEGSAIAFAEVFKQVREDMVTVKSRLDKTDAGVVTVQIENDIIGTLQEMIDALKKAIKDAKASPPKPPGPPGKPPKPGLIDEIAELKMIRSMQDKVNKRTTIYGKQYPDEQVPVNVPDPKVKEQMDSIRQELQDLSKRQDKIHKITDDIAKGKGKNID
jgi:hypothetical protein